MKKILFIVLIFISVNLFAQKTKYAIFTTKKSAVAFQAKINKTLTDSISGYSATQWCVPIKHKTQSKYIVSLGEGKKREIILKTIPSTTKFVLVDRYDKYYFPAPKIVY